SPAQARHFNSLGHSSWERKPRCRSTTRAEGNVVTHNHTMQGANLKETVDSDQTSHAGGEERFISSPLVFWLLLCAGLFLRLWLAGAIFLNPDEALHYLLSVQPSLALTYQETLGTAHPPLYIVFLHYWGHLGSSEFFLRLPSVAASLGFYWMIFLWLARVVSRKAALIAFTLMLFSPALIYLSVELR